MKAVFGEVRILTLGGAINSFKCLVLNFLFRRKVKLLNAIKLTFSLKA